MTTPSDIAAVCTLLSLGLIGMAGVAAARGVGITLSSGRRQMCWRFGCCTLVYLATFAFAGLRDVADNLGMPHVTLFFSADRRLGAGQLPSERLQHLLYAGSPGLFDKALVGVYGLWFFAPFAVSVYVLLWRWDLFPRYAAAWLAVIYSGLVLQALLPTPPPWMLSSEVARPVVLVIHGEAADANQLAAFPSLHVAVPVALALLMLRSDGLRPLAVLFSVYAAVSMFAVVYLGEHYVVDVVAGALLAVAAVLAVQRWVPLGAGARRMQAPPAAEREHAPPLAA